MNEPFICFEKTYRGAGMSKISWWGQALCYGRKLPYPPLIVIEYRVNTGTYLYAKPKSGEEQSPYPNTFWRL